MGSSCSCYFTLMLALSTRGREICKFISICFGFMSCQQGEFGLVAFRGELFQPGGELESFVHFLLPCIHCMFSGGVHVCRGSFASSFRSCVWALVLELLVCQSRWAFYLFLRSWHLIWVFCRVHGWCWARFASSWGTMFRFSHDWCWARLPLLEGSCVLVSVV